MCDGTPYCECMNCMMGDDTEECEYHTEGVGECNCEEPL